MELLEENPPPSPLRTSSIRGMSLLCYLRRSFSLLKVHTSVGLQISSVDEGCLRRVLGWEHKGICEEACRQLEQDAATWRLAPGSGQRDPPHGCGRMTPALPLQALLLTGSLPLWVHRNVSFL